MGVVEIGSTVNIIVSLMLFAVGAVECFAGYKTVRTVSELWGFMIGLQIGAIVTERTDNALIGLLIVILTGGAVLLACHFERRIGICILTASFGFALVNHLVDHTAGTPPVASYIAAAAFGALAVLLLRHSIIVITSASGAAFLIYASFSLMNVDIMKEAIWLALAIWLPMSLIGCACQYMTTSARFHEKIKSADARGAGQPMSDTAGLQRAYRNYCICCGNELLPEETVCSRCGAEKERME